MELGVEAEEAVDLLRKVLRIYSPSMREGELARFLLDEMNRLGYESVYMDEVGNVLGSVGGGESRLMYIGHMDTVPGELPYREESGYIYARGATDAKSALAAMVVAGASLRDEGLEDGLTVACIVDEEGSSTGFKHLLKKGIKAGYLVFGEPSGVEAVTIAYRGRVQLMLECRTRPGHAGSPWAFKNAVEKLYEFYRLLKRRVEEAAPRQEVSGRFYTVSTSITWIRGGEAANVIPGLCRAKVDVRLPPGFKALEVLKISRETAEEFTGRNPGVYVDVQAEEWSDAYEADRRSRLLMVLREAVKQVRGRYPKLLRKTGTGDMNLLAGSGVEALTYGPGESMLSHTDRERIKIQDYLDSIKVYRLVALKLLGSR